MANIFDTAKYILEKQGTMNSMKLQKLCYYCQAWALVWDDSPLFEEDFQAWASGPVCTELFFNTELKDELYPEDVPGGEGDLTEDQKKTIDRVLKSYGNRDALSLSQQTHMENPWNWARIDVPSGKGSSNVVTKESMAMYYGGLY